MSLPRPSEEGKAPPQLQEAAGAASSSSSWNRLNSHTNNFPPLTLHNKSTKTEDSDEDMFTVPDVEATPTSVMNLPNSNLNQSQSNVSDSPPFPGKRRRGRNPADKEHRRLKRLLRNRVSAQQARERKKVYVNELESRATELQDKNAILEERISTLINENTMLRKVLMNARPKADDSVELKQDQLSKS